MEETTWKPTGRWEDNINMDLQKAEWGGGHGLDLSDSG